MSYLLHIDATSFTSESYSRQVAGSFRDAWGGGVVHRDLAANPVPHLTAAGISARFTDPASHTEEQIAAAAVQDELIDEFIGAGGYLFTVPLYNYGIPSSFKAWLDQIVVVDRTIGVPDGQPSAGRRAIVVSARGSTYQAGTPRHNWDHVIPYLETVLGKVLEMELDFITPSFTLAPVVAPMAEFVPQLERSLADSHEQARKLAEVFTLMR
jgi:FMN-dependent NADH-azoreductase